MHVLQFAHIARPMVLLQRCGARPRAIELGRLALALVAAHLLEEIVHQQLHVLPPVAQRRQVNAHDIQPVEEVLAELRARPRPVPAACWSRR